MFRDLRFALRRLPRSPGFGATVIGAHRIDRGAAPRMNGMALTRKPIQCGGTSCFRH